MAAGQHEALGGVSERSPMWRRSSNDRFAAVRGGYPTGVGPFVCTSCSTPSEQASGCPACGNRSFTLSEDARALGESAFGRREPEGRLVSITDAPSLRRRRAAAARASSR
jgi:hypothetical protein